MAMPWKPGPLSWRFKSLAALGHTVGADSMPLLSTSALKWQSGYVCVPGPSQFLCQFLSRVIDERPNVDF